MSSRPEYGYNSCMINFYDNVAKKFGGYGFSNSEPDYSSEYSSGNPEEVFKKNVEDLSSTSLVALDVGCGDGVFAFRVANKFKKIIGLDSSKELLKIADIK